MEKSVKQGSKVRGVSSAMREIFSGLATFASEFRGLWLLNMDYLSSTYWRGRPRSAVSVEAQIRKLIHSIEVSHLYNKGRHDRGQKVAHQLQCLIEEHADSAELAPIVSEARETLDVFLVRTTLADDELDSLGLGRSGLGTAADDLVGLPETVTAYSQQFPAESAPDFESIVRSRRSVRDFDETSVEPAAIAAAIYDACHSPSACNRQPWRVYHLVSPEVRAQVLTIQNNVAGWRDSAGLLLVTCDRQRYEGVREMSAAHIDGGLFCMTLILGLHVRNIATCPLNMNINPKYLGILRQAVGMSRGEVPIMLVAFGNCNECTVVPRGKRMDSQHIYNKV